MQNFAYIYMLRVDVCAVCDRMHTLGLVDEGELVETSRFVRARPGERPAGITCTSAWVRSSGREPGGLARAGRSCWSQKCC